MKGFLTVVGLAALLASGAAAQDREREDELAHEQKIVEMKARHGEMLMSMLAFPDVAKRTREYRALRGEWVALRGQLRFLESEHEREQRIEQINENWEWTPPE